MGRRRPHRASGRWGRVVWEVWSGRGKLRNAYLVFAKAWRWFLDAVVWVFTVMREKAYLIASEIDGKNVGNEAAKAGEGRVHVPHVAPGEHPVHLRLRVEEREPEECRRWGEGSGEIQSQKKGGRRPCKFSRNVFFFDRRLDGAFEESGSGHP